MNNVRNLRMSLLSHPLLKKEVDVNNSTNRIARISSAVMFEQKRNTVTEAIGIHTRPCAFPSMWCGVCVCVCSHLFTLF